MKIIIVEDHKVMAEGLSRIFRDAPDVQVLGIANTLGECRGLLLNALPDLLLLDVALPDGNGIDFCEATLAEHPNLSIVLLTSFCEHAIITRALTCGARGYVLKSTGPDELLLAIRTVADGERYLCSEAERILARRNTAHVHLTRQEREMLKLIVEGRRNAEIAEQMHLGYETVKSYRKNLISKLDTHNTAGLVRRAMEEKWI